MIEEIELACAPESVAEARRWSRARIVEAGLGGLVDTVELLVSEVVTNAVVHAGSSCRLKIRPEEGGVRVEVADRIDSEPVVRPAVDELATSGRGMQIVQMLADDYGTDAMPAGGKVVWFLLCHPSA